MTLLDNKLGWLNRYTDHLLDLCEQETKSLSKQGIKSGHHYSFVNAVQAASELLKDIIIRFPSNEEIMKERDQERNE